MKKLFKSIISSAIVFAASTASVFAFNLDMGVTFNNSDTDLEGNSETNSYPVSIVALPSFSIGKATIELRLPVNIGFVDNELQVDESTYQPIEKTDDMSEQDYILLNAGHYLQFINYIVYGSHTDPFHFHFGKLIDASLHDGALVDSYTDYSVGTFESKPGLTLSLDGRAFNFDYLGGEILTDDLFTPLLFGGRIYVKPLKMTAVPLLSDLEVGFSLLNAKHYKEGDSVDSDPDVLYSTGTLMQDYCIDLTQGLFNKNGTTLNLYYDMLSTVVQYEDESLVYDDSIRDLSWQVGLGGWLFNTISYNAHLRTLVKEVTADDSFGGNLLDMVTNTALPVFTDDMILSGNFGYTSNNGLTYFQFKATSTIEDLEFTSYGITGSAKINKQVAIFKDFTVSYKKDYPDMDEDFVTGLTTLRNTEIKASCGIVYHMQVFTIGIKVTTDDDNYTTTQYQLGYRLSIL
jgi:hypothetical protein